MTKSGTYIYAQRSVMETLRIFLLKAYILESALQAVRILLLGDVIAAIEMTVGLCVGKTMSCP